MFFEKVSATIDNPINPIGICCDCTFSIETDFEANSNLEELIVKP